jgi:hypothetical protein
VLTRRWLPYFLQGRWFVLLDNHLFTSVVFFGIPFLVYFVYLFLGLLVHEIHRGCIELGLLKESRNLFGNSMAVRYALLSKPVKEIRAFRDMGDLVELNEDILLVDYELEPWK